MKRLLSVDFDYFFPVASSGRYWQLYDWGHSEAHLPDLQQLLWQYRAAGFIGFGLPLPATTNHSDFWHRFNIAKGAPLHLADSHRYASRLAGEFNDVWNFDAHHDCGYTRHPYKAFLKTFAVDAGSWMYAHHFAGASLHVRYPTWKRRAMETEPAPQVPVDRQVDNGKPLPPFDAVFICRSSAWVPTWVDADFFNFVDRYKMLHNPAKVTTHDDLTPRQFDMASTKAHANALTNALKKLQEARNGTELANEVQPRQ